MVSPKGVVYDCIIWRMVEFIRMLSRLLVVRSKSTFVLRPRDNLETWQLTPTIRKPVAIVAEKLTKRYRPYAKLCNKKFLKQKKKKKEDKNGRKHNTVANTKGKQNASWYRAFLSACGVKRLAIKFSSFSQGQRRAGVGLLCEIKTFLESQSPGRQTGRSILWPSERG